MYWFPLLLSAHVEGCLVGVDRTAVAVVRVVGGYRLRWHVVVLLTCTASLVVVPSAASLTGAVVMLAMGWPRAAVAATLIGYVLLARVAVTLVYQFAVLWRSTGGRPFWLGAHRGDVAITCLAAWPRCQGHGGRLMEAMAPGLVRDGRRVVAVARTVELADVYRRRAGRCPGAVLVLAQDDVAVPV